jgi:uncharacterized membrane protein YccF (DUF307 family)
MMTLFDVLQNIALFRRWGILLLAIVLFVVSVSMYLVGRIPDGTAFFIIAVLSFAIYGWRVRHDRILRSASNTLSL